MTALAGERDTLAKEIDYLDWLPAAAGIIAYAGGIIACNAAGYGVPASEAPDIVAGGRIEKTIDNRNGAAGDQKIPLRRGIFLYSNSPGGDTITIADRYKQCFLVDDQTVARTDGGGARSRAGLIINVEPAGVWVNLNPLMGT